MEAMTHGGSATSDDDSVANEYLTFTLGSEVPPVFRLPKG